MAASRYDGFARNCKCCEKASRKKYYHINKKAFLVKFENNKRDILKTEPIKIQKELLVVLPWKKKPTVRLLRLIKSEGNIICKNPAKRKLINQRNKKRLLNQKYNKISTFKKEISKICNKRKIIRRDISNSAYFTGYLKSHPCVDCGEKDTVVLEFDHVRGKKLCGVSELKIKGSLKKLIEEIKKCEVRCANCHRRVTHQRRIENN